MNNQKINKSSLFKLAWQFVKQTGLSFSLCLKKAWANTKLNKALKIGIVRFYFKKVDGSIREAWGTLQSDLLPETNDKNRKQNNTVQVYYDTEKKAFRCFKKFNLINV